MRFLLVLLLCLLALPAYAGPGQVRSLAVMSSGYPANVANTFPNGDWQSWTTTGTVGFDTSYYKSPNAAAWLISSASITKTVVTGEGEFAVWTQFQEGDIPTCTFQIDSNTPVNCVPSTSFPFQQFTQAITAGTHTLTIAGTPNLRVDDISYPHPQIPLWPSATAINGVASIASGGTLDTGTGSGVMSAGNITADAECASHSAGNTAVISLYVDGVLRDSLTCSDLYADSKTLTYTVAAGTHSARLVGTHDAQASFTAGTIVVPMP